jgi:hypothetical protein
MFKVRVVHIRRFRVLQVEDRRSIGSVCVLTGLPPRTALQHPSVVSVPHVHIPGPDLCLASGADGACWI